MAKLYKIGLVAVVALCLIVEFTSALDVGYSRSGTNFEISVGDEPGMNLCGFHCKLNQPMNGLEAGRWSRDIRHKENGRWRFRDSGVNHGDRMYCWIHVQKNGIGQNHQNIMLQF